MGEDRVSNELSTKLTAIHVSGDITPLIPVFFIHVTSKSVQCKTKKNLKKTLNLY